MTSVAIELERPAEAVFACATDPSKFSEWQDGVISGSMQSNAHRQSATSAEPRAASPAPSEPRPTSWPASTLRAWSVHGIDGPIRAQVDLDVQPLAADRARITISVDFTGHGIGRLLVPLVVRHQARAEMPDKHRPTQAAHRGRNPRRTRPRLLGLKHGPYEAHASAQVAVMCARQGAVSPAMAGVSSCTRDDRVVGRAGRVSGPCCGRSCCDGWVLRPRRLPIGLLRPGVGHVHVELLRRGAAHVSNLEIPKNYESEAARVLEAAGMSDRVTRRFLDTAQAPDEVEPADVVVLHRVVCCYPDYAALHSSAPRTSTGGSHALTSGYSFTRRRTCSTPRSQAG